MGKVGKFIAGVALTIGGFVVGIATGNWQLGLAISSLGIGVLTRRPRGVNVAQQQGMILENRYGAQNGIPVLYGKTRIGGVMVDLRVHQASADRKRLVIVVAWCHGSSSDGGDIQAIDEVWFDDRKAIDGVTVQAPFNTAVSGQGVNHLEFAHKLGANNQIVDTRLNTLFPSEWPSSSGGKGVAYSRFELWSNPEIYAGGVPNIQAVIRGVRVFDPRDSVVKHSDNPVLCIRDYLTSKVYGLGVPASNLDEQTFIEAANYCDELVTVPGLGSVARYTCNGIVDVGRSVMENLETLATSCRAQIINQGNLWRIVIRRPRTATGFVIDEENTLEGSWSFVLPGLDAPNVVRTAYVDAAQKFQADAVQWPDPSMTNVYLTEDAGYESRVELDLPFTTHRARAQQLAQTILKEARQGIGVTVTLKEQALQLQIGDLIEVSHPTPGWSGKIFDVLALLLQPDGGVQAVLGEYDANVYVYDTVPTPTTPPGTGLPDPFAVASPTSLGLDGARLQWLTNNDGTQIQRIRVTWVASIHPFVDYYEVEAKRLAVTNYDPQGRIPSSDPSEFFVVGADSGTWNVRIRAVNNILVPSAWVSGTVTVDDRAPNILTATFAPGHVDVAHQDVAHQDAAHSDSAHSDGHTDVAHSDSHTDTHNDQAHGDNHGDVGNPDLDHTDTHEDSPHDDSHSDVAHSDSHTDTHSDVGHGDAPHADSHTDATHGDGVHGVQMVIQGDAQTGSIKAVGRKTVDPSSLDVRNQPARDGRNVVIPLVDASTGAQFVFSPGDSAYVGVLPYSQSGGVGTEGPLALARTSFFPVAPVGTDLWVPS